MTRNQTTSNFESYCLHLGNIAGQFRVRGKKGDGTGASTIVTGTTSIAANTWYHFVLTVDNNSISVYTNGNLDATAATTFTFNYQANKKVILGGSNESNFNLPFTGSMDNLRFYSRVLTASEVSQLYTTDPVCVDVTSIITPATYGNGVNIFPNPSNGKFSLNAHHAIDEIKVYDVLGNLVLRSTEGSEIDIAEKPNGVYFAELKISGKWIRHKLVKE